MSLPATSLIISSRNRPQLLLETVESVLGGSAVPTELIVVDQSARPHPVLADCAPLDARCQVRYVWSDGVGLSRARNLGLATAAHPIVAFIDDDLRVAPDWYAELIGAVVEAGPDTVVTGRVLAGQAEAPGSFVPALVTRAEARTYAGRINSDVLAGCQFAMHRGVFATIGTFDERLGVGARFPAAEDNDFGFRLLEAGFRTAYAPQAVIYHRAWRGGADYLPKRWAYGRGQGGFYAKFASLRDPYVLRRGCADVALHLVRFPWRFLHQPRLALGDLAYALGVISGVVEWTAIHRGTYQAAGADQRADRPRPS